MGQLVGDPEQVHVAFPLNLGEDRAGAGPRGLRLHDARHTHASLQQEAGVHPKAVQERLGHGSIQITLDTYSHVTLGLQAAAAEKFDNLVGATHTLALPAG